MPPPPTKVIAMHLGYRSRAAERGRTPTEPSYFLKPPSSLAASGDPVARPRECELLAFEGEIALVIGRRAHRVAPADGWRHVGWVTAANDFGLYDLRHTDLGSNLRAKGGDGFTPLGPEMIEAGDLDPLDLVIRTWVNGQLVQEAAVRDDALFDYGTVVADLSRLMTLEPGDVILTGTPTGSTVVEPGDEVEVEVTAGERSSGRLRSPIVAADAPLPSWGAMPRVDETARDAARGARWQPATGDPVERRYGAATREGLEAVSTATLASQLRTRGLDGCVLEGLTCARPGHRLLGFARTVSYLPRREDLAAARSAGMNAQKRAVESLGPGDVLVIAARGDRGAGSIGDILVLRAIQRGAAGIITDGALRDSAAIATLDIPTYSSGSNPAVLGRRHVPWETGVAVACAGALITPGDLLVGDDDGVVVLPDGDVTEIVAAAVQQESEERFIAEQVQAGSSIVGLFPMNDEWRRRYEAWKGHDPGR